VHGEAPVVLEVTVADRPGGHVVTVTCTDAGPWDGTPPDPTRGRGLLLVRALADAVIDADAAGTRVQATLTC
jgi:anti-sigma regulatory factor (Ser/Thr protein kinase)